MTVWLCVLQLKMCLEFWNNSLFWWSVLSFVLRVVKIYHRLEKNGHFKYQPLYNAGLLLYGLNRALSLCSQRSFITTDKSLPETPQPLGSRQHFFFFNMIQSIKMSQVCKNLNLDVKCHMLWHGSTKQLSGLFFTPWQWPAPQPMAMFWNWVSEIHAA